MMKPLIYLVMLMTFALLQFGCSETEEAGNALVLEETGRIEQGDSEDENHAMLPYDSYNFTVSPLDRVTVEITAQEFTPLLKLVEVTTGAVLAEWDPLYSDQANLEYRIAGGGTCQARVYAQEHGSGDYTVIITVQSD